MVKVFSLPLCTFASVFGLYCVYKLITSLKKQKEESPELKKRKPVLFRVPKANPPQFFNPWYRYLDRSHQFLKLPSQQVWNNALFFPETNPEGEGSQTRQLIWYLQQAKVTLKMAMYTCSFKLLENILFELVEKGVKVTAVTNTNKNRWRKRGIKVREKPKTLQHSLDARTYLDQMHNKFIIIDDRAIITGSLNWTKCGVTENRENVVITDNPKTVKLYTKEFAMIWELSDPRLYEEPCSLNTMTTVNDLII